MQYAWPGNVRELSNLIERLLILYPNQIVDVADLPGRYRLDGALRGALKSAPGVVMLDVGLRAR